MPKLLTVPPSMVNIHQSSFIEMTFETKKIHKNYMT